MCHIATKTVHSLFNIGQIRSISPFRAMLTLEKSFQGTAPRPSVQPDEDFVGRIRVCRGEEPEEEFRGIFGTRDGQKASIGFADVEIDVGDGTAVDSIFWHLSAREKSSLLDEKPTLRLAVQEIVWCRSLLKSGRSRLCLRWHTPLDLRKRLAHMLRTPLG